MATIAYVRVSTDGQAESGNGLDAQRAAILSWAERNGDPVAAIYEDAGVSGAAALDKRPGLLSAIAELHRGDILVVAKRDRLSRGDVVALAMIEASVARKGARIVSVAGEGTAGDEPSDLLMRRLVDAFAEYERRIIAGRTRSALAAKRKRGERVGSIPFGFDLGDDGKSLITNPAEQSAIALMTELRARGASLRRIADELDARGIKPKGGKSWSFLSVRAILARSAA